MANKINERELGKQTEAFRNENLPSFQEAFEQDHIVIKQEIISEFGEDKANQLIERFVINRKPREFKYYNVKNPFKDRPLCFVGADEIFVAYPPLLLNSIYERLVSIVEDDSCSFHSLFMKKRGECVEKAFFQVLQLIFSDDAKYHVNVCETVGTDEHDFVVEYKDYILICEAKASKVHEPFFNPEKGYERLKRHFKSKSGIGYAYSQAIKLKKFLDKENGSVKTLYENKKVPFEINTRNKKIIPIVFTLEHFGLLEINASELLEKDDDQPYPWICCLPDLKNIKKILDYLKKSATEFIEYVEWRVINHRRFIGTIDELDILETYLYKPEIRTVRHEYIQIWPNTGPSIIDKIYFEEHGYKYDYTPGHYEVSEITNSNIPLRMEKVGRNDPCPCGSGKKFKKCCLGKR